MRLFLILVHASPVLVYSYAGWIFWRLAQARWTFPLWKRIWYLMLAATLGFSLVRVFNVIDALILNSTDALLPYQTVLVLISAGLWGAGAYYFHHAMRLGKML